MAYVLSLRPQSPLKRSFSDNPYLQSCSPLRDGTIGALRDITSRNPSTYSLCSSESIRPTIWLRGGENTPSPLASRSQLNLVTEKVLLDSPPDHAPRKRSCGLNRPPPSFSRVAVPSQPHSKRVIAIKPVAESIQHESSSPEPMVADNNTDDGTDDTEFFDLYDAIHAPLPEVHWSENTNTEPREDYQEPTAIVPSPQPFRRWMSTLRRRHIQRHRDTVPGLSAMAPEVLEDSSSLGPLIPKSNTARRMSDSMSSSMGCVTAMKSASITIASESIAPHSDAGALHGKLRLRNRGSYYSEARKSTESHGGGLGSVMDEGAWLRSVSRRKVVEELISSEESYIADLKVLINVCEPYLDEDCEADERLLHRTTS
jgi:hypothetical protein